MAPVASLALKLLLLSGKIFTGGLISPVGTSPIFFTVNEVGSLLTVFGVCPAAFEIIASMFQTKSHIYGGLQGPVLIQQAVSSVASVTSFVTIG